MASRFKNRKHPALPYVDLIWVDDSTFERMAADLIRIQMEIRNSESSISGRFSP